MKSRLYKRIGFVVFILSFVQSAYPQNRRYESYREALKSQQKMLAAIIAKLREERHSAIIELNGECYVNAVARSRAARSTSHNGPDDLASLLARYGHFDVHVNEGAATVVRERGVTPDVLHIILPSTALELRDRNDPNAAIEAILTNDAVTPILTGRHVNFLDSWEKLQTPPIEKPPVPPQLASDTLEGTIQTLLRAFPGVAVYQQCKKLNGERLIEIDFDRY